MTIELNGVARLAGVQSAAEPAAASAPSAAAGFVTTVRRADEIAPFETVVKRAAAESAAGAGQTSQTIKSEAPAPAPAMAKPADKARKSFEAFALQVFIGSMLPKENTKLFGTGSAGKMWQAMLAEKLADQIAASGRLKLLPEQPAGTASQPSIAANAKDGVPVPASRADAEARPAATVGANAALETLAMGLKPVRSGGTR